MQPSAAPLPLIHPNLYIGNGPAARSGKFDSVVSMADSSAWVDAGGAMKVNTGRVFAFTKTNTSGPEFDRAREAFPEYPAWIMLDTFYSETALLPYLEAGARWIDRALQAGGTVICHCQMGINRSAAAIVAYAVLRDRSMGARSAIEYVRRVNKMQRGLPALTPTNNNFEKILLRLPKPISPDLPLLTWVVVIILLVPALILGMRYMRRNKNCS